MKKLLFLATSIVVFVPLVTSISCSLFGGKSTEKPDPDEGGNENPKKPDPDEGGSLDNDKVPVVSEKSIITTLPIIKLDFKTLRYEKLVDYAFNIDKIPLFDQDSKEIEGSLISVIERRARYVALLEYVNGKTEAKNVDQYNLHTITKIFLPSKDALGNYGRQAQQEWEEPQPSRANQPILDIIGVGLRIKDRINFRRSKKLKDNYRQLANVKDDFSLLVFDKYVAQWFHLEQLQIVSELLYNYAYFKIGLIDAAKSSTTSLVDYYEKDAKLANQINFKKLVSNLNRFFDIKNSHFAGGGGSHLFPHTEDGQKMYKKLIDFANEINPVLKKLDLGSIDKITDINDILGEFEKVAKLNDVGALSAEEIDQAFKEFSNANKAKYKWNNIETL